jgi:protocatechuate 3,4-dioxygenase beta subunit
MNSTKRALLLPDRRLFLGTLAAAFYATPGLFAEELSQAKRRQTPPLTEGPFYPDRLPLDTDNDLIIIDDHVTPAIGDVTHLTGRVFDERGEPARNVTVEIWQCDAKAVYLNTADSGPKSAQRDSNFQGFGRFETGSTGEYRFRTIKPVPYPGRPAPHIHVKVKRGEKEVLTTQLFIRGFAGNARDNIFNDLGDSGDRELVLVDFQPLPSSSIGELAANFDIVLGRTPIEDPRGPRGFGPPGGRRRGPPRPPPRD